ncbi:hypothetical protein BDC45DRAFT_510271 [Circinella umbellata]|nr:hypothetical protein BDC45DRAFT_510271 [Circinella umbellata]
MDEQPTTTTQRTFSVTSSTATPSLVLGSNECADDPIAVNGKCPSDHFCNAALKQCNALSDNGGQCYEDFQCKSGYCNSRSCGDEPDNEASNLSGGQIAGITVGSIAGAVLLVGALMWCQKRRSRQVSTRARKFEQIRTEDEDLESVGVMRDTGNRTSKYNLLTSLMTGTAVGRSLSRMGGGYSGTSRSMNSQAYLSHSPQPAMSESSVPYSSTSGNGTDNNRAAAYGAGAAVVGGAALAGATHSDNNRQSKLEQPIDPTIYEDQQYYGNLAVGTSDNQNDDNRQALTQTQQQLQQQLAKHDDPYRMSQASAIDPFGAATAYNNATRPSTSIERPPTTVLRESTFNNLHAPIFHISAPQDDKTVPAGGGAYVPQLASAGNEQTQQSPEMDAFGGGKRGSWLLKEIAARWQQGSATGARASGVTTTTDASSINNEAINNNNSDNNNVNISPTKQLSPVVDNNNTHGALWDDGLVSAGGSSVARSASTASTNPFRSSLSNPRDSVISALRIPPIQEDAWTLEDHVSLSGDNNKTVTKENSSNDTSTQQQQHEHQETK